MSHLPSVLDRLSLWLSQKRPEVFELLQPGLSNEEIAMTASDLPYPLPVEVYELYGWKNGLNLFELRKQSPFLDKLIFNRELLFLPLSESIDEYKGFASDNRGLSSLFPVFKYELLCDYLAVSLSEESTQSVYYVYGPDPLDPELTYSDLTTMILSLSASSGMLEFELRNNLIIAKYLN